MMFADPFDRHVADSQGNQKRSLNVSADIPNKRCQRCAYSFTEHVPLPACLLTASGLQLKAAGTLMSDGFAADRIKSGIPPFSGT
ncbi:Unknown protein sequence [Pseudomonas savastanoi pv. glycinea]|nr:Unknown protein sequence [Pseudomonas savastanoi pv. glycinea]RMU49233.1 hypothetical protein ALP27_102786 [Pseudomonas savastanoi pv. glycinea]RMW31761.1 hypothetical protein ALO96_102852 [Pseudomonas savastanoi pv. glycinea]